MRFPLRWYGKRDGEREQAEQDYQAQLRAWARESPMPLALCTLIRVVSIHDGLVRRFVMDRARKTAHLRIRCGWNQVGYYDLDLWFRGVWFPGTTVKKLERLAARAPYGPDALHDEIDRDDHGRWIHRIEFWRDRETQVTFTDLALKLSPRLDRYSRR